MSLGKPYNDVFAERIRKKRVDPMTPPSPKLRRPRTSLLTVLAVSSSIACVAVTTAFLGVLFIIPDGPAGFGRVRADAALHAYGFGINRTLLVFNLTAFTGVTVADERGLQGATDIHATEKRLAALTMYRHGEVYNSIDQLPIALDQKGGDRAQINLGFEFRKATDLADDDERALIPNGDKYEDYFIRGCYFDPSCTRDLTPTVMDVTPQMLGETVEVLFWDADVGYTYEGVYNLFVKLKRRFYEKSVPWVADGKKSDTPCNDSLLDLGIVYESERARPERGEYADFEQTVQADAKYPKASYWDDVLNTCAPEQYASAEAYYTVPNMANTTTVPLKLRTFVQMYIASQLMMQVDFAFHGVQQFYYKNPNETELSTGPPYDFDGPWDLCKSVRDTPDIKTCVGDGPSPLWVALGNAQEFTAMLGSEDGLAILNRNYESVAALYSERIALAAEGHFARHDARWPISGRGTTFYGHLIALGRALKPRRATVQEELEYQRDVYAKRFIEMSTALPNVTHFSVKVSRTPFAMAFMAYFWWAFTFIPLTCGVASFAVGRGLWLRRNA